MPNPWSARGLVAAVSLVRVAFPALLILTAWAPAPADAQTSPDPPAIAFLGFRPGRPLSEIDSLAGTMGGHRLHCEGSRVDPSVSDCRSLLVRSDGDDLELWLSAVDSLSAVITISGAVSAAQLDRWKECLGSQYGPADTKVQGAQRMMQWIRNRQMIRLTWRWEREEQRASVSLVDGPVLDGWGDRRSKSTTERTSRP
jgi:hypothetical protein